ncbi:MAG: hypothetical protein KBA31_11495 [Alphaproteobacteria bacterium]|nr:hypothetical protein [Alphaproteobacteria bacterium]
MAATLLTASNVVIAFTNASLRRSKLWGNVDVHRNTQTPSHTIYLKVVERPEASAEVAANAAPQRFHLMERLNATMKGSSAGTGPPKPALGGFTGPIAERNQQYAAANAAIAETIWSALIMPSIVRLL